MYVKLPNNEFPKWTNKTICHMEPNICFPLALKVQFACRSDEPNLYHEVLFEPDIVFYDVLLDPVLASVFQFNV